MRHPFRSFVIAAIVVTFGFGTAVAEDAETAWEVHPVLIGTRVPDISFLDEQGEPFSLRERVEEKPLSLVIYRGLW